MPLIVAVNHFNAKNYLPVTGEPEERPAAEPAIFLMDDAIVVPSGPVFKKIVGAAIMPYRKCDVNRNGKHNDYQ